MIRVAITADAALLAALAERTFREAYSATDFASDIDLYTAEHFTHSKMLGLLSDPGSTVFFAEQDRALIGYAHVQQGVRVPPCVMPQRVLELSRLYLTQATVGQGHGAALMQAVFDEARRRGCTAVWLSVYSLNGRAIRFYERMGFERAGTCDFVLGRNTFTDPVYTRPI